MRLITVITVVLAGCACGRGAAPTPAPAPVPSPDAASDTVDAPTPSETPDAGAPVSISGGPADSGDSGFRKQWRITCTITTVDDVTIGFTCQRAVKRGWEGDLWDDVTNKAVAGSRFKVVGSAPPARVEAAARLRRPFSVYGSEIKTVRIVEQF